jgi:hypothetical protein
MAGPPAALGPSLRRASLFGVAGAFVPAAADANLSPAQAGRALAELRARRDTASTTGLAPAEVMAAIFGRALPYCVPFSLPPEAAQSLQSALGAAGALFDGGARRAPALLARWLRDAARVRPALDALRRLSLLSRALGRGPQELALAQLPLGASVRWAGADAKPPSGLACLVFDRSLSAPAPAAALRAGLLIDEWTETAPNQAEHTGVAFHRVDAGSEAPQAILIAVSPDRSKAAWSADALAQVLGETLELAKLRALDLELLGDLGQLLPALCLASNPDNAALGVRFAPGELRREEQP